MERFREHEKEFKMKQYSKRALQADAEKSGNFVDFDDEDEGDGSYGDSNESGADSVISGENSFEEEENDDETEDDGGNKRT